METEKISDVPERVKEAAGRFNEAASKLVEAVGAVARDPGQNSPSQAELNVDFALSRLAFTLKAGGSVAEPLRQLEQTTIVKEAHVPEADVIVSQLKQITDEYRKAWWE